MQDNADLRLTELGYSIGLADEDRYKRVGEKKNALASIRQFFKEHGVAPEDVNRLLEEANTAGINQKMKLEKLLARPQINIKMLAKGLHSVGNFLSKFEDEFIESAEIEMKYEAYIEKEVELVQKMNKLENIRLDEDFDYSKLKSLSMEARQKLAKIKPSSLGQASRISGVSPADVSVLLVHMGR